MIETKLRVPFDFCHDCDRFSLNTEHVQGRTNDGKCISNLIIITCDNAGMCQNMYKHIKREVSE